MEHERQEVGSSTPTPQHELIKEAPSRPTNDDGAIGWQGGGKTFVGPGGLSPDAGAATGLAGAFERSSVNPIPDTFGVHVTSPPLCMESNTGRALSGAEEVFRGGK